MSLADWEKRVKSNGWALDALYQDLEKEIELNNQQKSILCLSLIGTTETEVTSELDISRRRLTDCCSSGLYTGLKNLLKNKNYHKINTGNFSWTEIKTACKKLHYYDLKKERDLMINEAITKGYLIPAPNCPPEIIDLVELIKDVYK